MFLHLWIFHKWTNIRSLLICTKRMCWYLWTRVGVWIKDFHKNELIKPQNIHRKSAVHDNDRTIETRKRTMWKEHRENLLAPRDQNCFLRNSNLAESSRFAREDRTIKENGVRLFAGVKIACDKTSFFRNINNGEIRTRKRRAKSEKEMDATVSKKRGSDVTNYGKGRAC